MNQNLYPHLFQPLTIRGVTLKNRLEYAPTVVLKCNADGTVGQDMLDFMAWQAKTGAGWVTVGDTPVTHDKTSHWLCEMNVCDDDCIHGMNALAEICRQNGAEISAELAYAGRGNRAPQDGSPIAIVSAERPLNPEDNVRTMNRQDMDEMKAHYADCALRCKHAGFRMVMIHCAHQNFLAQWLSPASNVRTDEYGGSPENRRRYPLEVLKAVREAVGEDMVIEMRVSAVEGIPGGMEFEESLAFMKEAQEYVDIVHVSQGSIFHLSARYCIPTYFREPHKPLNVDYAAEVKKHLHVPVAVVGMITTLEQAEEIIASGKADIVAMAKSFMADGDIVRKSLRGQQAEIRPCTRCDLCGNANTWGTNMSCAINPRCGVSGQIQSVPEDLIEKENPDAIIVATGSVYVQPPIPGIENALPVRAVDAHEVETGENVVVCGGGITGLECALALAKEGKSVTVVDQLKREDFIMEMPIFNKADLLDQLQKLNVTLIGGQRIQAVKDGVEAVDTATGEKHFYPADSVVNALGVKPDDSLGKALLAKYGSADVIMVGDCTAKGGTYYRANHEAYYAAMRI